MKKIFRIVVVVLLILIFSFCITSVYAVSLENLGNGSGSTGDIERVGANILQVLSIIASAISIIAMIALGIKYMMGSAEEKASYKKTLLPYFIGAIFVFGATAIPAIIYNIF